MTNTKYIGPNYEQIIEEAKNNPIANALLTLPQVARLLQLHVNTVRNIVNSGDLPYINVSGTGNKGHKGIRISISDLNDWIESRRLVAWDGHIDGAKLGTGGSRTMTEEHIDLVLGRLIDAGHKAKLGESRVK